MMARRVPAVRNLKSSALVRAWRRGALQLAFHVKIPHGQTSLEMFCLWGGTFTRHLHHVDSTGGYRGENDDGCTTRLVTQFSSMKMERDVDTARSG